MPNYSVVEQLKYNVRVCPACGMPHENLTFFKAKDPYLEKYILPHGLCPTDYSIILRVQEDVYVCDDTSN